MLSFYSYIYETLQQRMNLIYSSPLLGRCKCNGHAAACSSNTGETLCLCEHNTAGKDCEKCLPLFNDQPWKRGSKLSANPCRGIRYFYPNIGLQHVMYST